MTITRAFALALLACAGITAGCGSGSPTTPATPALSPDASAGVGDASRGAIEIRGTVGRVTGACPALRFLVGTVTVQTSRATVFTAGTCANVVSGAGAVATGARSADGSLAASSVAVRGATSTR